MQLRNGKYYVLKSGGIMNELTYNIYQVLPHAPKAIWYFTVKLKP